MKLDPEEDKIALHDYYQYAFLHLWMIPQLVSLQPRKKCHSITYAYELHQTCSLSSEASLLAQEGTNSRSSFWGRSFRKVTTTTLHSEIVTHSRVVWVPKWLLPPDQ